MIGVILKTLEAFTAFIAFRKQWFIPTKFLFDVQDIDDTMELIISDTPLLLTSNKILILGKDIMSFQELGSYVSVVKARPIGVNREIDAEKLRMALPDVSIDTSYFDDVFHCFEDAMYDSSKMEGLDFPTEGLSTEEIEREKNKRIASILAQRAEEKRQQEEQARLEAERLKAEEQARLEAERKAEEERQEAERKALEAKFEAERREAIALAERQKLEAEHKAELDAIKAEAERNARLLAIEAQKKQLAEQEESLRLKSEEEAISAQLEALNSGKVSYGTGIKFVNKLTPPVIKGFDGVGDKAVGGSRLKIGGRRGIASHTGKVYIVAGAIKGAGSSTVAYNLAHSIARNSNSTLLIDLDFINNSISNWFNINECYDSSIDVAFNGQPFENYLNNISGSVARVSIGKRTVSVIGCNSINRYDSKGRMTLCNFNYVPFIKALATRFNNIVVDIGSLSSIEPYQKALLNCFDFKSFVCYGSRDIDEVKESLHNVYNVSGYYTALLCNSAPNINRIVIEKTIRRPICGVIYHSSRYYDGCNYLYEDDTELKGYWSEFLTTGGCL